MCVCVKSNKRSLNHIYPIWCVLCTSNNCWTRWREHLSELHIVYIHTYQYVLSFIYIYNLHLTLSPYQKYWYPYSNFFGDFTITEWTPMLIEDSVLRKYKPIVPVNIDIDYSICLLHNNIHMYNNKLKIQ